MAFVHLIENEALTGLSVTAKDQGQLARLAQTLAVFSSQPQSI
jgi:hypothetical protein